MSVKFLPLFLVFSLYAKLEIKKFDLPPVKLPSFADHNFLPSNILTLSNFFADNVLIVEKSTHLLHLFKNTAIGPKYVRSYPMATGKTRGNKKSQGDLKTPEGIYGFVNFMDHNDLYSKYNKDAYQYGSGAFVLNYPNKFDRLNNKSGGGIWLHSTNDESRITKGLDSKGCVVVTNKHLKEISQHISLGKTPIIIVQDLNFVHKENHLKNKQKILKTLMEWKNSWINEDLKKYLSFYHPKLYKDSIRTSFREFALYKKNVFSFPGRPEIELDEFTVMQYDKYAVAMFIQKYKSNTINDSGKKVLYLIKDHDYSWKIVNEAWSKLKNDQGNQRIGQYF